jgi:hypothetical protein
MDKTGFVVKVTSKNREYFYLRRSFWKDNRPQNKNIFSFGNKEKAVKNLNEWKNDFNKIPIELKKMGYDLEDVLTWIEQIESK